MVATTDGDYDLPPPRTGVLKKYDRARNNVNKLQDQTRLLEVEAYKAVLRAFGAQSENLTWKRLELIGELRKELRVTDDQHKELVKVANDATVLKIRESRKQQQEQQNPQQHQRAALPAGRKRKLNDGGGAGVMKKVNGRAKKPKAASTSGVRAEEPDLSTVDALNIEVGRLEQDPDLSRLLYAKKAAHELKQRITEALEQCGADDEDSEKTEERRDADEAGEEEETRAQEVDEVKEDVKREVKEEEDGDDEDEEEEEEEE